MPLNEEIEDIQKGNEILEYKTERKAGSLTKAYPYHVGVISEAFWRSPLYLFKDVCQDQTGVSEFVSQ
jgi:hypothetical protein